MTLQNRRTLILILICVFVAPVVVHARSAAAQEKLIRETYHKLESYNAAAEIFHREQSSRHLRSRANLSFELTGFRSDDVREISGRRYAKLVTLPTGARVFMTHGGNTLMQGTEVAPL